MKNKILPTLALAAIVYSGLTACNTHVSASTDFPPVYFTKEECSLICSGKAKLEDIQKRALQACEAINPNGNYKKNINYFNDSVARSYDRIKNYEKFTSRAPECAAWCLQGVIAATCD